MFESLRSRFVLAIGIAGAGAVAFTAIVSSGEKRSAKKDEEAAVVWKRRTGVDLKALPRLHPPHPDSEGARALDALLEPAGLQLGSGVVAQQRPPGREVNPDQPDALRDYLRAAIRSNTTEPRPVPPKVVSLIERHAKTLDAAAEFVAMHQDIRWREDFGPRDRMSMLFTYDHLALHRLLIGRAFLALERHDVATAVRMLGASQRLNAVLAQRHELQSQNVAIGVERLQLALIRRGGSALGIAPAETMSGIRQRYLAGMSGEAALVLARAAESGVIKGEEDDVARIVQALAAPKYEATMKEALTLAAEGVAEILKSQDGCAALAKNRRRPEGFFSGEFWMLNATEVWRRFVVLQLDRAITAGVVTGRASSPCPSVMITVRDEGKRRTVEAKGLPADLDLDRVVALPPMVTTRLD